MNKEKLVDKQPPVFNTICCRNDPPPMFTSYIYLPKQVKNTCLKPVLDQLTHKVTL